MEQILKFEIPFANVIEELRLPISSEILSIQDQDGKIQLWAKCNRQNGSESRYIETRMTGENIPELNPGATKKAYFNNTSQRLSITFF